MLTVVCDEPHVLSCVTRAMPTAGAGEALVRIRRVGLCGTDYHIYAGRQPFLSYPRVMGHELAGEIEQVREGSGFRRGQIVTVNPYLACGNCVACRRGKPNCCANVAVLGVHTDGGMSEWLVVPETALIDASGLTLDEAAMIEFLAVGAHAVARGALRRGDRVLVRGAGPIGIAVALFARLDGAEVVLADTRPARLRYAREAFGFDRVIVADEVADGRLRDLTGGDFFDSVFDATGSIEAMRDGLAYVAHGGTYVLVSVVKDDLVFADPEFHKRETTLLASRNALSMDFERVVTAMRAGDLPADRLKTHALLAAEVPERLPQLVAEADEVLKAIVTF
ncbi:Alcohol dehydrogenase GroES-like domain protein [Sphingomonas sp. RIT328]|nr:Alcohol dehydrogenase GroES-like domain protein [Sphingomonas sp. RIT328]